MNDIAQFGIAVDTSQTIIAARELDKLVAAGGRAEGATKSLGNASRQSMAEMASASSKAAQAMERMAASQERQERLAQQMSRQMQELTGALQGNATANNAAAQAAQNAAQALGHQAAASKSAQTAAQGQATAATNAAAASGQMAGQAAAAGAAMGGLHSRIIATVGAVVSLNKVVQDMDAWTNMNNRIKLVTETQGQFAQAQSSILQIANDTRQPLKETADLYQRLAMNQKTLGLSGGELAGIVKTISQSMVISGVSTSSGAAALMQLGQAFNSGVLRGEEFNSVMEQAPGLMQAIAAGMGKTVGEMRGLAEAGKITTEELVKALQKQAATVEENYSKMGSTVGQSLTVASNKFTEFVGRMDDASGASKTLSSAIIGLSNNLGPVVTMTGSLVAAGLATWLTSAAGAAGGLGVAISAVGVATKGLLAAMGPAGWLILGLGAAATAWQLLGNNASTAGGQMESASDKANAAANKLVSGIVPALNTAIAAYDKMIGKQKEAMGTAKTPIDEVSKGIKEADLNLQKLAQQVTRAQKGAGEYVNMGPTDRAAAEKALTAELEKASKKRGELAAKEQEYNANVVTAYVKGKDRQTEASEKLLKIEEAKEKRDKALAAAGVDRSKQDAVDAAYRVEVANIEEAASKKGASAIKAAAREAKQAAKDQSDAFGDLAGVSATYYKDLANYQKQLATGTFTQDQYTKAVERLIAKQPFAIALAKEQKDAWKEQEKEREKAFKATEKAFEDEVSAAEKSAKSVTDKVAQLKVEEAAQALVISQNIALSAAIEQVMIKRLEEQAIVAKDAGKQELLDSLNNEIAARKELAEYTGRKEGRDAAKKAADKAADDWKKASDKISNDLTDALMRGFESGKDFAKNMRDVIVNMFKTMVLKPTVSAIMSPITGSLAGGGVGGASSGFGSIGNLAGVVGGVGSFGAGASAGLAGLMGEAGLMGSLDAGVIAMQAGNLAGGLGTLAGALGPLALGIGAVSMAMQSFQGETRTGSRLETTAAGTRYAEGPSGGRLNATLEDKLTKAAYDGINAMFKNLGSKEVLGKFVSGLETSDKGRGGVFAGGALSSGATFGDVQNAADYKFNVDLKAEDAIKAYAAELNIATVEALKAATDLPKYAQRVLGDLDMKKLTPEAAVEALQVISEYPSKILELAGTSRDALVTKFTEGLNDRTVTAQKAGQNVADMLVASIEQSVYQRGMGQIFDIVNQGIITPVLDAMVTGAALSETISQESIDATIARATAAATALGSLFKNEQFQNVLAGLKTTVGAALGNAAGQVGYEPKYQIDAAKELDKAAQDAAKAAEDAKKKWQDITDSLLGDKTQLGIDLLRAQGKEEAAVAAERAKATEGYDAYQISLYDANQALKKQIAAQESLNALNSESADLQIQLMQAQGQQEQAVAKARQLATKGMGDAEVATYDYNKSLEKQIANQEQLNGLRDDAASLEVELLRALGKEESALAKEREIAIKGMDDLSIAQYDANQSARKLIGQVQDLSGAFDSAVAALASPEQKLSMGYTKALGTLSDAGLNITAEQAQTYTNAQILEFIGSVSQMGDVSADTRTKVISAAQAIGELNNQALDMLINRIQKESDTRTAAWQKELNVAQERAGIEQTALQLIGNTSELRKRELEALDATNRALQERVYAVQDASDGVDKTLALVQRSVDAEKTAISKAAQAQIDAITNGTDARSKAIDAAKKSVTDLTGIFDDVTNAVKTLRQNVLPEAAQMAQARAYISMALSVAQAGGQVNSDRLKESLAVVTKDTADTYATGSEFRFTQARQANELERLGNAMGAQKDKAQATLDAAENAVTLAAEQIKAIEKARDAQLDALDAQLKAAQDSVSVMRGVDISVIGVGDAIGALDRAMATYEATRDALAREQLSAGQDAVNRLDAMIVADQKNTADLIAAIRERAVAQVVAPMPTPSPVATNAAPTQSTAGGGSANLIQGASNVVPSISNSEIASAVNQHLGAGGSLMDVYNAAQQYGVSSGQLAAATGVSQSDILAWTASQNLPSFDVGTNYVPRDMIAQIHEGEAIVPKAFNPAANGSADNSELISEIRNLRAEVQRLQQIAQTGNIEQRRAADAVNGRPEAPMLVAVVETV